MAENAAGHVVISGSGKFLSRSMRWVKHRNRRRGLPGNRRAWVHPTAVVLAGGNWAAEAYELLPARYDQAGDYTTILGEPISYHAFIRS